MKLDIEAMTDLEREDLEIAKECYEIFTHGGNWDNLSHDMRGLLFFTVAHVRSYSPHSQETVK
jgi:hypothetical protein